MVWADDTVNEKHFSMISLVGVNTYLARPSVQSEGEEMTATYDRNGMRAMTRATQAATGQTWCAKGSHLPDQDCKLIRVGNGRRQWICSHHAEMAGR